MERMLKTSGRRLDVSSPFVDAALPDGSRLHVVIPDVTRKHWAVNIRKFIAKARRLGRAASISRLKLGCSFSMSSPYSATLAEAINSAWSSFSSRSRKRSMLLVEWPIV